MQKNSGNGSPIAPFGELQTSYCMNIKKNSGHIFIWIKSFAVDE